MTALILVFPSVPATTAPRTARGAASVLSLADGRHARARLALASLRDATALKAAWDDHAAAHRERAKRASIAAADATRRVGAGEWTTALQRRATVLALESARVAGERREVVSRYGEVCRAAGAALAETPRPEARRLYAEAFPGLTPQRVGMAVSVLVRDHRAARRFAREAV